MTRVSSINNCSICQEELSIISDRTIVKLKCEHEFHLDCIGSAFNAVKSMRCPNCLRIESGTWKTFGESESEDDDDDDEEITEEELAANLPYLGVPTLYVFLGGNNNQAATGPSMSGQQRPQNNLLPDLNLPAPEAEQDGQF